MTKSAFIFVAMKKLVLYTFIIAIISACGGSPSPTAEDNKVKADSTGANGGFKVQVANGQTCTPTVYVQEDGSYNGARARLILKRNDAMGIAADVVLDTATAASDGAWEA